MSRVLITGGAGFIGSHLVAALDGHCEYLAVLDDLSTGRESNIPGVRLWPQDVADPRAVELAAMEAKPDLIFHLAAQTSVPRSVSDMVTDARTNVLGTVNVLRAANQHRARVIFASTGGAMYGECHAPATEETPPAPVAPYAVSKLAGEEYLAAANRYKPERKDGHVILRLGNVYGPRQDAGAEGGVVATFLTQMLTGRQTEIHGAGAQERDFLYVADAVRAFVLAGEHPVRGIFNVGTGRSYRIDGLHRACAQALGGHVTPRYVSPRRGDIGYSRLHVSKIAAELGWAPLVGLQLGLAQTAEWFREQLEVAA